MSKFSISVFGTGYVGCVTSSCLAHLQHSVIGVDINKEKVDIINQGLSPINEPLLKEYISLGVKNNLLEATVDDYYAIENSDISFICVGTPPKQDGSADLTALLAVIQSIGESLNKKYKQKKQVLNKHIIIVRSTIPPGTIENQIIPTLEKTSRLKCNIDFYVCFHPEFLREGTAIADFFNPAEYVIGESNDPAAHKAGDRIIDLLNLDTVDKNTIIIRTNYKTSELIKYTDNSWHALKVTFANEIGTIAEKFNVDARELMNIFCLDTKLNISDYYLKPGLSYGGSCLPKDLLSLEYLINQLNLNLPLLHSIEESNQMHIMRTYNFIKQNAYGKIGWYGLSFKDNTDDLRNSVYLELLSVLRHSFDIKFSDHNLNFNNLNTQEKLLKQKLPNYQHQHASNFLELLEYSDTLVIGHDIPNRNYKANLFNYDKVFNIIDLTDNNVDLVNSKHRYHNLFTFSNNLH